MGLVGTLVAMRSAESHRSWRGAGALFAAIAVLLALSVTVSSDARIDHPTGATSAAQALVADDVPPGIVPEVAALAVVWLAMILVGLAVVAVEHRRAQPRRGRAPPALSVFA